MGLLLQNIVSYLFPVRPLMLPMTSRAFLPSSKSLSLLALVSVLLSAGVTGSEAAMSVGSGSQAVVEVKIVGDWQRPAPVTWSSRLETRWSARWGTAQKYIV